uniref:Ig-like domain-containing protein n=1 Tax=Peromyscus maniculatus bairdii TaxID=230844 RepID=A0A8C8UR14_PERMB
MELTSAPFHKAEVFWRGFLLTVSLLTYWTSPTTAQITVEVVPPHVAEGQNILLVVHNLPARYAVINWYKGQGSLKKLIAKFVRNKSSIENGPGYTHRETIYPNGSLFINNVKMEDEELYTLHLEIDRQSSLWVNTLSLPITTKNSNPLEGEDSVALMCEPRTQNAAYLWRIHGQSLLSKDNNTLKIVPARRNDSGDYYCKVSNQISSKNSDPIKLEVMGDPAVLIISPSNIHFHSSSNLSLSCHTDVNPPAKFFWFINGELQSSSQDRFISNININNSDPTTALSNTVTVLSKTTVKNIRVLSKWISEISAPGLEWNHLAFWEAAEPYNFQPMTMEQAKLSVPPSLLLHPYG